ncbi:MAG TPA: hypothetical protein VMV09_08040 [Candidatus Saccharimonadales bacterium]|nr:hypothetical protein [Candidatus Saccharimonadales bacterium]
MTETALPATAALTYSQAAAASGGRAPLDMYEDVPSSGKPQGLGWSLASSWAGVASIQLARRLAGVRAVLMLPHTLDRYGARMEFSLTF